MPAFFVLLATTALSAAADPSPAHLAWQRGQLALDRDRFDEAITQFELSLRLDPTLAENHLSLAAVHVALEQEVRALSHLNAYLGARPDHVLIRPHIADLLLKLNRPKDARRELERFVADIQPIPRLADTHLINSHTRLMRIAMRLGNEYEERLHRGIGLYLLALKRSEVGDDRAAHATEELLFQAASELTMARMQRPKMARPSWYLHGVWGRLDQRPPAVRCLRAAAESASFNDLTPSERLELELAFGLLSGESRRK